MNQFLCFAIPAIVYVLVYLYADFEKKKRAEFLLALMPVSDDLIAGKKVELEGMTLEKDTYLCTYEMCLSFIVIAFKFHSRYVFPGTARALILSLVYSACSFLFGWWSLRGLFWTPAVILGNFTNANRRRAITIAEEVQSALLERDSNQSVFNPLKNKRRSR